MSLAVLLSQQHRVKAFDINVDRVRKINERISPVHDELIEQFLAEKELDLSATSDSTEAFAEADFVIIAVPTNYDPEQDHFDCSEVE